MKNKSLVTTCLATLVALLGIWLWRSDRGGVVVSPTFAEHVAPIVFDNCVVCHQPEGIGPFTLLDYDEVKARGAQIAEVTRSGYMPPWLPERGGHSFVGERGLTQDEIDTLRVWVETGMPPGDPQKMPARATLDGGWPLGEPDLVVTMPEVFELSAEGSDVFRNFVIPLTLDETKYVRAVDLRPGATKALHHAVILVDETESSRLRDAEDDVVGFEGMEIGGRSKNPEGHFVGWTPGKTATLGDPDLAWALPRGSDLVLMLHLLPSGRPEPVQVSVGLYFSDRPPSKRPMMLRLGSMTIDIPPEEDDYTLEADFLVPADLQLLSIYPHAHYLGKSMLALAHLPDGSVERLLEIRAWDFNWQDEYRYVEPLVLPAGSRIEMIYRYDNSSENVRNPNYPPRRVHWGPSSLDEMGDLWLQVVPMRNADREVVQRAITKEGLELVRDGARFALELDADDARAHNDLAVVLDLEGKRGDALAHLRDAVRIDPEYASAQFNLGVLALKAGERAVAKRAFERTLEIYEHHAAAALNLGSILSEQGRLEEAARLTQRARSQRPDALASYNLGVIRLRQRRLDEAVESFLDSLRLEPANPGAHSNLGVVYLSKRELEPAQHHFREAIALNPRDPVAHNNLGIVLMQANDLQGAAQSFAHATSLDPTYQQAIANHRRVKRLLSARQ